MTALPTVFLLVTTLLLQSIPIVMPEMEPDPLLSRILTLDHQGVFDNSLDSSSYYFGSRGPMTTSVTISIGCGIDSLDGTASQVTVGAITASIAWLFCPALSS